MDFPAFLRLRRRKIVNRLAEEVENTSEGLFSDRNGYRMSRVERLHASYKTVGASHRDTADNVVADVLSNLDNELLTVVVNFDRIEQIRQTVGRKLYIENCADYLNDGANVFFCHLFVQSFHLG